MARYIALLRFTEQGLKAFAKSPDRAQEFQAEAKKLGVTITEELWLLGAYDGLISFEAADDSAATAAMLKLSAKGNVHTQTLRAFSASEIKSVIQKSGG